VSTQVRYVAELLESLEEELGSKFDGGTESQSTHELHRQSWSEKIGCKRKEVRLPTQQGKTVHVLGRSLAGFEVAAYGRFSGVHRGTLISNEEWKHAGEAAAIDARLRVLGVGTFVYDKRTRMWKRVILFGLSFGAGFALVGESAFIAIKWYQNRPKPPRAWNKSAITATFDSIRTEGNNNTLVFYYILENRTRDDYRISNEAEIEFMTLLKRQASLFHEKNWTCDTSVFLPAGQKLVYKIHLNDRPYEEKPNGDADADERNAFRVRLTDYVRHKLGNVDGFVIFDQVHRYQIDFPAQDKPKIELHLDESPSGEKKASK
jgi:hypothetical protein